MKLRWTILRPDGRKRWGVLKQLVVGGALLATGWWSIQRMQRTAGHANLLGAAPRAVNPAAGSVHLGAIARSAQSTEPYVEKAVKPSPLAQSQVGMKLDEPVGTPAGMDAVPRAAPGAKAAGGPPLGEDSVFAALAHVEETTVRGGRPVLPDESTGSFGGAAPEGAPGGEASRVPAVAKPLAVPAMDSLIGRALPAPERPAVAPVRTNEHIMNATHWLPRGEIIPVYLMQTVQTGRFPTLVEFAVARTVWFNGKPVLPFGTRFTATAGLGVRDRITFNIDALRRRDGLEIALGGLVLGPDQSTGLPGYYVPPPTLVQLAPYIGNFFQGYADLVKLRVSRNSYQVGSFGVSITPDPGPNEAQQLALSAASQALGEFIAAQVAELKERYAAYLAVPAGSPAFVQLTGNSDLSALWDHAPRGQARTVGDPRVVPTDLLYRQRELERSAQPALANLVGQAAAGGGLPGLPPVATRAAALLTQEAPPREPGPDGNPR